MIREERAVLLGILTLIGFAFLMFVEFGSFVYPFPLNEVVIVIVAIRFFFWNRTAFKLLTALFLIDGIFALLSNEFFWALFVSQEAWELLYHGVWLSIFKLSHLVLSIALMWLSLKPLIAEKPSQSWTLILPALLLYSSIPYDPILETIAYVGMGIIAFFWKPRSPMHNLWLLWGGLSALKLVMLLL
ncbi:MAG: hypothetical protein RL632_1830 [Bacteroidota bacterium]|jgi:hypothetical protein